MSDYNLQYTWSGFDAAGRVISGSDFQDEFEAIQTAVNSKADSSDVGKVLQVVYGDAASTVTLTNSSAYADNATASITPSSTSSKILIIANPYLVYSLNGANQSNVRFYIDRDGTSIYGPQNFKIQDTYVNTGIIAQPVIHYLDSPATTSSVTYTVKAGNAVSTGTFISYDTSSITLMEIAP